MPSLPPGFDLCAIPAGTPPVGQLPNFTNPESLAAATWSVCIILTTISAVLVCTRVYVNFRKMTTADYFMIMAGIMTVTYTGLIVTLSRYNRHQWDVPACWLNARYLRIIFSGTTIVGAVLFFPKCAILLMYRQLFRLSIGPAIWIGLIFTFAIYFPSIPLSAVYEAPRPGQSWEEFLEALSTKKSDTHALIYWGIVQGSCSVILDLYIFVLPLPTLMGLKMALRKRVQLIALFATAIFGVAASVIALVFRVRLLHDADSTWVQAQLAICVVVENNVATTVGCLPAFAIFVRHNIIESSAYRSLRSKFFSSSSKDTGLSSGATGPAALPLGSFGSKPRKSKQARNYYELSETHITVPQKDDHPDAHGIMRTVNIHQQSRPESTSHSVEQLL